jgi:hypothetical protein
MALEGEILFPIQLLIQSWRKLQNTEFCRFRPAELPGFAVQVGDRPRKFCGIFASEVQLPKIGPCDSMIVNAAPGRIFVDFSGVT